jgi:hypothetical protein
MNSKKYEMQSMSSNLPIKAHKDKPHLSQNMCQNMLFYLIYVCVFNLCKKIDIEK